MNSYFRINHELESVKEMKLTFSHCNEREAENDMEAVAFRLFDRLDDDDRVLMMAIVQYGSSRGIAGALGTNNNYASKAVKELREKVKKMLESFAD